MILEGEASVELDGESRAKLARGDFFGEISALTGEPPTTDVVATTMLRCLVIPGPQLEQFLLDRPRSCCGCSAWRRAACGRTLEWQP